MDFIIGLPKSKDYNLILIVVDKFSKYATFIIIPNNYIIVESMKLFLKHEVKYWGLPK